jgi:hypothetical protein
MAFTAEGGEERRNQKAKIKNIKLHQVIGLPLIFAF